MIYILQQPLLFVKSIFHYVIAVFVVGTFFVFRNFVEKFCVSWAFPLIECVAVWALKPPVPIPTYSKPTRHKVFLRNYWNTKELAANICHKPILPNSVFLYLITAFRNTFLDAVAAASSSLTTLPFPSKPK